MVTMARPRKRKRPTSADHVSTSDPPSKRKKDSSQTEGKDRGRIQHPVLSHYYPQIQTLRDYIIAQLPSSSRLRRRKVAAVGVVDNPSGAPQSDVERSLGTLLDTTLVGISTPKTEGDSSSMDGWKNFSQRGDESYVTLSNGIAGFAESQAVIVEYVVRTIFNREKTVKWPDHLLCDGFRRDGSLGLRAVRPNHYVEALQQPPWPQLLALLGESGDRIMIDLLLDCAIFEPLSVGINNVCQISGKSLSNIPPYRPPSTIVGTPRAKAPSELFFVRTRMFYAKPALNTRGQVQFGLRHIHVLNRSPFQRLDEEQNVDARARLARQNEAHTLRVMMYMFPRQFGLHNVFTSVIDRKETSQRLKDYTLREEEIFNKFGRLEEAHTKTPKRLRGCPWDLVRKLQVLHQRCSYSRLLQHYCPLRLSTNEPETQSELNKGRKRTRKPNKLGKGTVQQHKATCLPQMSQNSSVTELATSPAEVSAFCEAVLTKVIPRGFWGCGPAADNNRLQLLRQVHRFISLRRFENMSLHELSQGMKISDIDWLAPPRLMANKMSLTDAQKRSEVFDEFLYFLFDTILIPLIRSNFYVTESNTDKYRIFFFRHDVWRSLVEPAMSTLKGKMLEEVSLTEANRILQSRRLGFSHIRLLPKGASMRPITNLRKRTPIRGNSKQLGPGINKILAPVHTVLQLERIVNPSKTGSTLFSVGDIYKRIKTFKAGVSLPTRFYFAKADVQSAFDTIPQAAIVSLLDSIPQQRQYRLSKYLEVGTSLAAQGSGRNSNSKPIKRWPSAAIRNNDPATFVQRLEDRRNITKRNTVFTDLYQMQYETSELLQLVASHIQQNLIKVGKKYYRQKQGIPQGSILSSTLCNYFYADLEIHVLPFLDSNDCLLLRLIDDFLLITTDKRKATRFIEVFHHGVPEYGVTVNPKKTLVNFDLVINEQQVSKLNADEPFPYCGAMINTRTLDIVRASNPDQDKAIYNSLTVEFSRTPGQTFQRKVINAFKIQSHVMFFDTGLNSAPTMLTNIHRAFIVTATKMWAYARCLPATKRPPSKVIIGTIQRLADTAYQLLVSRTRRLRYPGYVCDVKKCEVTWLAYNAFRQVLGRKQSQYGETLAWLKVECIKLSMLKNIRHARVQAIV